MADCHNIFLSFNEELKLSESNRMLLTKTRDNLRMRMSNNFLSIEESEREEHELQFVSQGSYVMDTIITPKDEDFDLDDGVYIVGALERVNRPPVEEFHKWVIRSVNSDDSYEEVEDKDTCVRVKYKDGYHIDLPIYYAVEYRSPDLAHKRRSWLLSNPVEFINWFEQKVGSGFNEDFFYKKQEFLEQYGKWTEDIRKNDAQLRRIVRYMKGWADHHRGDMPPGIVMTVLAGQNYKHSEEYSLRDDRALLDTLINALGWLEANNWKCPRPTTPVGEDLFEGYSPQRLNSFKKALGDLIAAGRKAVRSQNEKEACMIWQAELGPRLPCQLAKDEVDYSSLAIGASKSDLWTSH